MEKSKKNHTNLGKEKKSLNVDMILLIDSFVFLLLLIDFYLDLLPGINHLACRTYSLLR